MTPLTRRDVLAHQRTVPWPSQRQVEQDLLRPFGNRGGDKAGNCGGSERDGTHAASSDRRDPVWVLFPRRAVPDADQRLEDIHEMLGTKMRALFQRKRGRDLFDLYWALTLANPPVDPAAVIELFKHYLRQEGSAAGRAEFMGILESHLADRGFCSDMDQLLRVGAVYDPRKAGDYVKEKLLSLLPVQ